ncbi:hypothetical protein QFC21_004448 [Naganishia friedmannii]|uniref:Uncharacterized protein n=1 Tax=Naganishia friedmannii TaxID=89922 RepID=A0ACC2VG44_9TREE|nr:hypothetical protein QFC21_004448 [Naganishia friedmannii]
MYSILTFLILGACAFPSSIAWQQQCEGFIADATTTSVKNLATFYYPAGSLINVTSPWNTLTTTDLPAFCRLKFDVLTNPMTGKTAGVELWLPDDWNTRMLAFGGGGWSGGVPFGPMGVDGVAQGYASYGTNGGKFIQETTFYSRELTRVFTAGHQSDWLDGSWGLGNDDAIVDFGYRAVHLSVVASKALTSQYYGNEHSKSYFSGCSNGGRQGIKSMASYPEDFDGLIVGSPANPFGRWIPWTLRQSLVMQPVNSSRWISTDTWAIIHQEILRQCDALDGVVDGYLHDPKACNFRPELATCRPNGDPTTCLSVDQLESFRKLYTTYVDGDQNYMSAPYTLGGELLWGTHGVSTPAPWQMAEHYYKYFVLNDTNWDWRTLNASTIQLGIDINPGEIDVSDLICIIGSRPESHILVAAQINVPDLTAFFARGGKVIQYTGWSDELIAPGDSLRLTKRLSALWVLQIKWYSDVSAFTLANTDINPDEHFRLFMVPGMTHCAYGPSAWAFGANEHRFRAPHLQEGPRYDAQAAIVEWVENNRPIDDLVATKYENDTGGIAFTRKLCPSLLG